MSETLTLPFMVPPSRILDKQLVVQLAAAAEVDNARDDDGDAVVLFTGWFVSTQQSAQG